MFAHQGDVGEPHDTLACSQVEVVSVKVDTIESLFCHEMGGGWGGGKSCNG